jgi:hypothetical protein
MLGGQYFFAGDKSKLNANVTANAAPAVKLGGGRLFLPLYTGSYRGTKSVTDSVGSGSLFAQGMSHRLAFGYLRPIEGTTWKVKPSVSYKWDYLKETRDETWGRGLFDTQTVGLGFEAENTYKEPFTYRFGYDFFYTRFPNFKSLESKSGVDATGNPLGRETAGVRTLDTLNSQLSFTVTRPIPYEKPVVALTAGYRLLWQKFHDQPLVNLAGQFVNENRQDFTNSLTASAVHPREAFGGKARLGIGFNSGFNYTGSNQNTYDAGQTRFIADAYSNWSLTLGPSLAVGWGPKETPTTASAGLTWTRQSYFGRLVQDANGLYQNDTQNHDRYQLSFGFGTPIATNFRLLAQANFLWVDSNMRYEKTYKYTYNTSNYLLGFSYDY